MKLGYDYDDSFLLMHKNLTKVIFLEKAGVASGFSYEMFSHMYDSITSERINVDKEYQDYYSFEYPSLEAFLYKKFNIKAEWIDKLVKKRKKNPECILYRKDDYAYGDYGLAQFTFSDTLYKRIIKILLLKEKKHEN
jgi:hypothetical protein